MENPNEYKVSFPYDRSIEVVLKDLDLLHELGEGQYHCVKDQVSYQIDIESLDVVSKKVVVNVNGQRRTCVIHTPLDQLIQTMNLTAKESSADKSLFSAMPGLVKTVFVEVGQKVISGTPLLVLEAMKMENVLKSGADGVIKAVHCAEKDAVDKNQLLVEIE